MSQASIPQSKVLIADDTPLNRRVLSAIVRKAGHLALEAADGQEALQQARKEKPDLLLLDINMPHLDGYQVLAELKSDPELGDVPIVLISSLSEAVDKIKGLDLGAADYVAKPFNTEEVSARIRTQLRLRHLTRSLMQLNSELTQKQNRLEEDLKAAADIQRSLIPPTRPSFPGVEVAWRYLPWGTVSGDLFNVHQLDTEHVAVFMLDVTGHGVPAALVTVSVAQALSPEAGLVVGNPRRATSHAVAAPADVLSVLERDYPFERFERFFTMSYLLLNTRNGVLRYCGAGHPAPFLRREDGTLEPLPEGGPPVGLGLAHGPPEEGYVRMAPGDRVFLYTDGVVEQSGPDGEAFGMDRLRQALEAAREPSGVPSLDAWCDGVLEAMLAHAAGVPADDDISLLALEYRGHPRQEDA